MKRIITQTAKRTIELVREIVIEFPDDVDPESINQDRLAAVLREADVEWEVEDKDFDLEGVEWSDTDDDAEPDVVYEE